MTEIEQLRIRVVKLEKEISAIRNILETMADAFHTDASFNPGRALSRASRLTKAGLSFNVDHIPEAHGPEYTR